METRPTDADEPLPNVIDSHVLGNLYDRHYDMVLRYCHRRLYIHAVAEDVTSGVFLRVAEHVRGFTGKTVGDFRCWLYGIANHEIAAHLRKTSRRRQLLETAWRTGELTDLEKNNHQETDHSADVLAAMVRLRPADQAMLSLRYWEDLSYEEIAHVFSLRNGAVRTRLNRALNRLRKLMPVSKNSNESR